MGFYHIETFADEAASTPERLYSLQARINADCQITPTLGAFASIGVGDTRYYHHASHYRTRAIVEAGVTLKYFNKDGRRKSEEDRESSYLSTANYPLSSHKRPWLAALEVFGINAGVWAFDSYVMNEEFAKISIHTVKHNLETGFVWDNDQFSTNLFAHPYHGGLYFNAARSNGLTFWESAPFSFCGSLMWETICEIEPPAINYLMATTMGGICIG